MTKKLTYPIDLEDLSVESCPIIHALNVVGQKWKLPILWYLHEKEATRYAELKERIPNVSNMMLTRCLRDLEEDGLIVRKDYHTVPKRVEYSLSSLSQALLPALNALYAWGEEHIAWSRQQNGSAEKSR